MLKQALLYASLGLHVFPLAPGTKRPITRQGFKDATTNAEQIRAWWTMCPDANIGWDPHKSGYGLVDLDRGHDPFNDEPTYVIGTPSGGEHHIFEGVLPSTTGKLGYHIDTRGGDTGYGVLPPSLIDERDPKAAADPSRRGVYVVKHDRPIAPVSAWVVEKLRNIKPDEPAKDRAFEKIDTPDRVAHIRDIAANHPPCTNGDGTSDNATFKLANRLLDFCSVDVVVEAMMECWANRCGGEWDENYIRSKVAYLAAHVGTGSRKDAVGCNPWHGEVKRPDRFKLWTVEEFADQPEPECWDPRDNVVPKGGIVLVYGQPGSHKTNLVLTLIFDMMANGAKVVYAAGEGSHGVGKKRIPAHIATRENVDTGKLRIVRAVPLLQKDEDVAKFIGDIKEFKPDIVVLDTLATATTGLDENNSQFSSLLTDNGAVGQIRNELGCTVILIAHEGKNAGRGIRGHSGLLGNVDVALQVTKTECKIRAHVEKMRDGEDDRTIHAKVEPLGVPVPVWVSGKEYDAELLKAWHQAAGMMGPKATDKAVRERMIEMWPEYGPNEDSLRTKLDRVRKRRHCE